MWIFATKKDTDRHTDHIEDLYKRSADLREKYWDLSPKIVHTDFVLDGHVKTMSTQAREIDVLRNMVTALTEQVVHLERTVNNNAIVQVPEAPGTFKESAFFSITLGKRPISLKVVIDAIITKLNLKVSGEHITQEIAPNAPETRR